ncbi:MAG TPA: GrpB family protein [Candidatus Binatia bacterium]|jgi:GrpB-like predicted nucleotidyltransferase (UPF0157 family)|nr:GrpB family protein [Candidatus Binatia bacterium]
MRVLPYFSMPAEFCAYDPGATEIARLLCGAIQRVEPELQIEHVGSTSVPGCGGKGMIDLAVLYPEGFLARARAVLDGLGFQKQGGPEPFPENRPMRVGCVEHDGCLFRIHAHVIARDSEEHDELVWFRETLRADSALRQCYEARKRAILASGIQDSLEYCKAKGAFVTDVLQGFKRSRLPKLNEGKADTLRLNFRR